MEDFKIEKDKESLSTDQLLEYIKKQKFKIKKLQIDNEKLTNQFSNSLNENSKNWYSIEKKSFQNKKIVYTALKHFIKSIELLAYGYHNLKNKSYRKAFEHWKAETLIIRSAYLSKELAESQKNICSLEQRIAKLKALLARTHQANQVQITNHLLQVF